jgi:hypothetical protein
MAFDYNSDFDPAMNLPAPANAAHPCEVWEPFIILLASGEEISPAQHAEWIEHAAACEACSSAFAAEREMLSVLSEHRVEPDATLLATFRAGLEDAIDREEEHTWFSHALRYIFPAAWLASFTGLASASAWSAAALLLAGFSSGLFLGPRVWHRVTAAPAAVAATEPGAAALQASQSASGAAPSVSTALAPLDFHTADVAGISVLPSGDDARPQIQLQLREQQPVTVEGTVDDDNVKSMLISVLSSGDRYSPDERLDAVDLLSSCTDDPQVRTALCHAVHKDRNAAVRLKALEALKGEESQDTVQQTLLDALVDDQNPGVRVEAIGALRNMVSEGKVTSSDKMLSVLQDRMQHDPSPYIRLQSAAAIRDLGPRGKY